jgi:hypothetical protein
VKRKLNPGQQGQQAFGDVAAPGGVHIQNINEVHYHVQNDDYEPDLLGLEQARRNVDALIEKEELIFQATEKLEAILEYLKKSANQIDIQRDKDGQPIYRSNGEIVDKVVSATQILDQLKADLLAATAESTTSTSEPATSESTPASESSTTSAEPSSTFTAPAEPSSAPAEPSSAFTAPKSTTEPTTELVDC